MVKRSTNILVISFDLDGTLVTRDYVDHFWFEIVPRLYAMKRGISIDEARRIVMSEYDGVGPRDVRWYLPSYWFRKFGIEDHLKDALSEASEKVKPYEDAIDVVERLRRKYTLVLCTSAAREFIDMVLARVKQYSKAFRHIFSSSSDFGFGGKPPEFYRIVVRRLGVAPSQVLHIGDDLENDYRNAIEAGLRAALIDRGNGESIRDVVKRVLEET